jgi:hypothetical protein
MGRTRKHRRVHSPGWYGLQAAAVGARRRDCLQCRIRHRTSTLEPATTSWVPQEGGARQL